MRLRLLISIISLVGFSAAASAETAAEKWVCKKDGKEVTTKGKTDKDHKKACEDQGATWEKVATDEPKKQDAGGGGGW